MLHFGCNQHSRVARWIEIRALVRERNEFKTVRFSLVFFLCSYLTEEQNNYLSLHPVSRYWQENEHKQLVTECICFHACDAHAVLQRCSEVKRWTLSARFCRASLQDRSDGLRSIGQMPFSSHPLRHGCRMPIAICASLCRSCLLHSVETVLIRGLLPLKSD